MTTIKPVIGIATDIAQHQTREKVFAHAPYIDAISRSGAIPLLIPPQTDVQQLRSLLDGIVLMGGSDCDPALYGEEAHDTVKLMDRRRQENDVALARLGRESGIPTLGICLGLQVMNVAAGGTLIQDINSHSNTDICHESAPEDRVRHVVEVRESTRLASIIGAGTHDVNSSHHQAVKKPGRGLQITALAPDGIVEAMEDPEHPFYVGVQWHPEDMAGESSAELLFAAFVTAAAARRAQLQVGDAQTAAAE